MLSSGERLFIEVLSSTEFYILPFCVWSFRTRFELTYNIFFYSCHKRRFVSFPVAIKHLLHRQDCKILKAVTSVDNHPLGSILPSKKENKYILRKEQCALPKVNTERFMTSYVN